MLKKELVIGTSVWKLPICGYSELDKEFNKKGANDLNNGMRTAIIHNHIDLVKIFVENGAKDYESGVQVSITLLQTVNS